MLSYYVSVLKGRIKQQKALKSFIHEIPNLKQARIFHALRYVNYYFRICNYTFWNLKTRWRSPHTKHYMQLSQSWTGNDYGLQHSNMFRWLLV